MRAYESSTLHLITPPFTTRTRAFDLLQVRMTRRKRSSLLCNHTSGEPQMGRSLLIEEGPHRADDLQDKSTSSTAYRQDLDTAYPTHFRQCLRTASRNVAIPQCGEPLCP